MKWWLGGRRDKHRGPERPLTADSSRPDIDTSSGGHAGVHETAASPVSSPPATPHDEWRSLAPIHRTSSSPPLTAPLTRITRGLAAKADTGMVLAPLGHQRRDDAPIGVVGGTITPTARSTSAARQSGGPALDVARPATAAPTSLDVQPIRWNAGAPSGPIEMRDASHDQPAARATADAPTSGAASIGSLLPARRLAAQETSIIARPSADRSELALARRPTTPSTESVAASMGPAPVSPPATGSTPATPPSTATPPASPMTPTTADPPAAPTVLPDSNTPSPLSGQRTVHRRRLGEPLVHRPSTMVSSARGTTELPTITAPGAGNGPKTNDAPATARTVAPGRGELPQRLARRMAVADPSPGASGPNRSGSFVNAPLLGGRSTGRAETTTSADDPKQHPSLAVSVSPTAATGPIVVPINRRPASSGSSTTTNESHETGSGPSTPGGSMPDASVASGASSVPPSPQRSHQLSRQSAHETSRPEAVPSDLRAQLEPVLGTDLSDVAVHRGPASAQAASEMRAAAFTRGGEVHLPEKLGPVSHGDARETLAHELTHVAQQRRLGSTAPVEDTPSGQRMEAEARAVARRTVEPQRVAVKPSATRRPAVSMEHTPAAAGAHQRAGQPSSSLSTDQAWGVAADIERAAMSSGIATKLPTGGVSFGGAPSGTAASSGAQRLPETSSTASAPAHASETSGAKRDELSPERIEELTSRLYEGIRSRLRHDLLIQRERSGVLFDRR